MATQDRLPTGGGSEIGWTASAGLRYECVDDAIGSPDDDSTYVSRADSTGQTTFTGAAFAITSSAVTKLTVTYRAKAQSGTLNVAARIRVNGTMHNGTANAMSSSYADYTQDWLTNPGTGSAWTEADIEGTGSTPFQEFGVRNTNTAAGEEARCTQVYATVDYTASGGTTFDITPTGTLTSAGALVRQAQLVKAGTATSAGALLKDASKALAGTLTTAGALTAIRAVLMTLTGAIAPAGALVRDTSQALAGTLATVGTLVKDTAKALAGTLTTAGAFTGIRAVLISLAGTLTSAGALVRDTAKAATGSLTTAGALVKDSSKGLTGTLTTSGALAKLTAKALAGTLTLAGDLVAAIIGAVAHVIAAHPLRVPRALRLQALARTLLRVPRRRTLPPPE